MHLQHNEKKRKLLESIGDTGFSNKVEDYLRIVKSAGFEVVLKEDFY